MSEDGTLRPLGFRPPRWIDKRLFDACALIEAAQREQHPETEAYSLLQRALDAVEDADVELERIG